MSQSPFRPAVRANVPLIIGFAGTSGSGKSLSSLKEAKGLTPRGKRFAVIDTENGRASHYADSFSFDVADLRPPFSPDAYSEAILAADAAGYPVIVVDSMSHEYAGEGGILEMHEAELTRMAGDDWKKRESCKMAAWINPKTRHKHLVQRMLQIKAHLILTFRAEEKITMERENGKMVIKKKEGITGADGYFAITEKNLPYELTASFLLKPERPGYVWPIKLQEQHKPFFPLDRPIGEEGAEALSRWAAGGTVAAPTLASILTAIKVAETVEQLQAVAPQAAKLSAEDKPRAQEAFKAKKAELSK